MDRRQFVISAAASLGLPATFSGAARAQAKLEKPSIVLGVGGKTLLYYLPLTIAERQGFFKEQGLAVEIQDFGGGSKSLQSLIGGSVDCVTGAYEHTIRMQAKGQDIRAVTELGRFPAIVICVRKDLAGKVKSAADFKGLKIGVTAPGSSTYIMAAYAMNKAGLKPSDASFIGVGSGASAVAAMKRGDIDVISHLEPVIGKLEGDGDVVTLIDTRTEAGTKALFGGSNPAAVVYLKQDFITANPNTTQAIVNAFVKSLKWLAKATPDDVANAVPAEYHLGDRDLYLKAVKGSLESYSRTGIIAQAGQESVYAMLKALDPELAASSVDLSHTFDGRFVAKANV
ncbi:MAG: ABC transporter substrate-binding protein [Beijerinckiaceae bacterium]|nr:ABC transporter substrate-binding protein [Beijerinckiaceae bacterium]